MRSKLDIERSEICLHPPEKTSNKKREHQGAPLPPPAANANLIPRVRDPSLRRPVVILPPIVSSSSEAKDLDGKIIKISGRLCSRMTDGHAERAMTRRVPQPTQKGRLPASFALCVMTLIDDISVQCFLTALERNNLPEYRKSQNMIQNLRERDNNKNQYFHLCHILL